jgi:plasmid stabilization system protein ParE
MPRQVRYTHEARDDLDGIWRWKTQPGSGLAARRPMTAIRPAINRLREHPCLHSFGQHRGIRELPCEGGYRALYEVIPDTGRDDSAGDVVVLRVFGPGQSRDRL